MQLYEMTQEILYTVYPFSLSDNILQNWSRVSQPNIHVDTVTNTHIDTEQFHHHMYPLCFSYPPLLTPSCE